MRRFSIATGGIVLAAIVLLAAQSSIASAKTVKFLTANVGNMEASSASYARNFRISEYDIPVLKENIAALDPDIIFLQEIDSQGKQQEKRIFHKKYQVRCAKDLCVAIDGDKYEFLGECDGGKSGYMLCSARAKKEIKMTETCVEEKDGYVCASRRALPPGDVIKLFNVHSSAPSEDKNFAVRSSQICGMLKEMKSFERAGYKVLTGGDFNFDPVYESKMYNKKNDRSDPLFNLNVCWGNMFSDPEAPGLKLVSPDEPTWFTVKVKMLVFNKQLSNSLDHVITNLKSKPCSVLDEDSNRLDVDRAKGGKPRKPFMDHRAVLCQLELPD